MSTTPGHSFLDVGTGTGILAIAAAKLGNGNESIHAIDVDADAVDIARLNAQGNGIEDRVAFQVGTLDEVGGGFDFVCANLTADVIVPILPDLIGRTRRTLVLSGILVEQEKLVTDLIPEGIPFEIRSDGEWISIRASISRAQPVVETNNS